jgi:Uma2 family endonuclease
MVTLGHPVHYTFREYVLLEETSNVRHEYLDGQIYAMAGGTPEHSALIASVCGYLTGQVRGGPCRVHMADLRIRVTETGLATYPDVAVVCGRWERDPESAHTIVNPTVMVEVLSPTTEKYDRGEKLEHYKRIPSARACLLVAHDRRELELWSRADGGDWTRAVVGAGGTVEIDAIGARLAVDAVYDDATEPA